MNDAAAYIVTCQQPVRPDLSLNAKVPLVGVGHHEIPWNRHVSSKEWEVDVWAEGNRERIPAGITLPWIVERTRTVQGHFRTPGRLVAVATVLVEMWIVGEDPVCSANRHKPIAADVPGHSQPRCKTQPV